MRLITSAVSVVVCLTAFAGCGPKHAEIGTQPASAGSAGAPSAAVESASSPSYNVSMSVMRNESADTLTVTPLAAWSLLPAAYASVGLELFAADSASTSVASPELRIHQFLGGQPLSRYLECGQTAFGDVAATQEIVLRVRSTVESGPDGTAVLRTAVRAVATPQGNDRFRCTSTRRLELRIVKYIQEHAPAR